VRTNGNCIYQASQPLRQHRNEKRQEEIPQLGWIHATTPQNKRSSETFLDPEAIEPRSKISNNIPHVVATSSISPPALATDPSTQEIETLKSKIRQLEDQLKKTTKIPAESTALTPVSDIETTHSHLAGTFHVHNESLPSNQSQTVRRSFIHKRRFFGQSHWISSLSLVNTPMASIAVSNN
jgi:hypothetical protein